MARGFRICILCGVGTVANKIWLDPLLGRDLYTLWAGPELKSLTDKNDPKITKVDINRIWKICRLNITCCSSCEGRDDADDFISAGVWIPSSKINHDCVDANVMFGHHDSALVMMVTTFKEVKKGEEIVASYAPGMMPLSERDFMLSHSGFICKCRLCELDRSESADVIEKRDSLLKSLKPANYLKMNDFKVDLKIIRELELLRIGTPDLNFVLMCPDVYKIAAILWAGLELYELSLFILENIYPVVKNIPTNYVNLPYAETILFFCMKMGKEKAVLEKWVEEVRKYYRLVTGTLEHIRAGAYPTIPEDLKKFGIQFFNEGTD
ncbi:uncharacterized protein LOC118435920 [Folsomia candida]|uniref:uncharacterized protein LOC118435920 n=1 Tax=Folsomia candida TaxID=158441 RepID=UPI0016055D28|nr:uncharacterized protein LOC118435920 [Folsomia candida]